MEYWDENVVYAPHWTVQEELPQKKAKFNIYSVISERAIMSRTLAVTSKIACITT